MMRPIMSLAAACLMLANAVPAGAFTQTNVLQSVALQLSLYQQGPTNSNGRKVSDIVTSYTTKNLIQGIASASGQSFGANPKLVLSTAFAGVTITNSPGTYSNIFSTNFATPTNNAAFNFGTLVESPFAGTATVAGNLFTAPGLPAITIPSDVFRINANTNESVVIPTNATSLTLITSQTNSAGAITNYFIQAQTQITPPVTQNVLSNVSTSVAVLSGTGANLTLTPVTNYVTFAQLTPEIVAQTGTGLTSSNIGVNNLASQTGVSLQQLTINYGGSSNLSLNLQGFVHDALKVDLLATQGTNRTYVDVFGATANWNAIGNGTLGSSGSTNLSAIVAEGTVSINFLKNLPQ